MDLLQYIGKKIKTTTNANERLQYREDMVKAIINSYPPDTKIKTSELATATGYTPSSSGIHNCIGNLIDRGEITRSGAGNGQSGYVYTILVPGNTYDEERGVVGQNEEDEEDEELIEDLPSEGYVNSVRAAGVVAVAIMELMKTHDEWFGTPTELYTALDRIATTLHLGKTQVWPKNVEWLMKRFNLLIPKLSAVGIGVTMARSAERIVTITRTANTSDGDDGEVVEHEEWPGANVTTYTFDQLEIGRASCRERV